MPARRQHAAFDERLARSSASQNVGIPVRDVMILRTYLIGKLHGVRLTDKNLYYQGSITLSREYLEAANLHPHELVQVVNVTTGARLTTYIIPTDEPGVCALNGGAARHAEIGDLMIVMSFGHSDKPIEPRIAIVGEDNRVERTFVGHLPPA